MFAFFKRLFFKYDKDYVAHELKAPLTVIRGYAETLHDHSDLPKETQQEITNKILRNCERMERLLKNLLTLSLLKSKLESELCDINAVINSAIDFMRALYPDLIVNVEGDGPFYILGNSDLMEQVFINIMDNAAKYSLRPAQINVRLKKHKNQLIIEMSDRGMGISSQEIKHIFNRFYMIDRAHSKQLGGTGLGLFIVNKIIEKHRGSITCKSELGKGTTFQLIMPLKSV